ncbi:guanylate cyclase activator 1 [Sarotherodon galilaeus]
MKIQDEPSTVCSFLEMEGTQTTTREEGTTERNGDQGTSSNVPMSSKPLHRFVRKEPRSLGIVILMFGCAELLVGFQFSSEDFKISPELYIPFWQGALFLTCGILSVYTELHPSKKMVTVCLALYVVSIFGIVISFLYRIIHFFSYPYFYMLNHLNMTSVTLLKSIEAILLTSSFCVLVILIFLATVARFALKSTHTQLIIQQIPPPRTETTSD